MIKTVLPCLLLLLLLPLTAQAECIQGNCKNGTGVYEFTNGSRYKGTFRNGRIEGEGTIHYSNKSRYTGSFVGGDPHGHGTIVYGDGTTYTGNFDHGTMSGQGVLKGADGAMYEGEFQEGMFNGQGKYTFPDGKIYEGGFRRGQFDGQGTLTTEESVLKVEYEAGACVGKGTITLLEDNTKISGECENGEFMYTNMNSQQKKAAGAEKEKQETPEQELEFQEYKPENFYREPSPDEIFVPRDYYEAKQSPQEEVVPVPESDSAESGSDEKM